MATFTCHNCDFEDDHAKIDGYGVGDTLLEGVYFKCWIDDEGEWQVEVLAKFADYFSDFNEAKWIKKIIGECKEKENEAIHFDPDVGSVFTCPKCGYTSIGIKK